MIQRLPAALPLSLALGALAALALPSDPVGAQQTRPQTRPQARATAPPPGVAPSARETRPLGKGRRVPDVGLRDPQGDPVSLREVVRRKPTVLVFYRGGWCPYCNLHLAELGRIQPELRERGYQILAISPDRPEKLRASTADKELGYTLLSDSRVEAARAFGLAFRVSRDTLKKYDEYGIDLEDASGRAHHVLPVPAVYVVDPDGRIRFAHADPDYRKRLSGEEILAAAR